MEQTNRRILEKEQYNIFIWASFVFFGDKQIIIKRLVANGTKEMNYNFEGRSVFSNLNAKQAEHEEKQLLLFFKEKLNYR